MAVACVYGIAVPHIATTVKGKRRGFTFDKLGKNFRFLTVTAGDQ